MGRFLLLLPNSFESQSSDYLPPSAVVEFVLQQSPQRIVLKAINSCGTVFCRWVRTTSLRKGKFFHARSTQQPRVAIVSFDAARLVIKSIVLIALLRELLRDCPWLRPHSRVFNCHHVFERSWPSPRPALYQMQVLARAQIVRLRTEVRHVDDEGIALPVATRVAIPLADVRRQMGAPVHDDVALPALALPHVVEDRDAADRLNDLAEAAGYVSKFGQPSGQAAIRQRAVLRPIMPIHTPCVVARGRLSASRRGRGIVFSPIAGRIFDFASLGRLHQGE